MEIMLLIIGRTLSIWLGVASYAMIARMLLPLFVNPEGSVVYKISYAISEPVVLPVRFVMAKMGWGQNSPLDIPFTVSYFLIIVIRMFLP